MATMVLPSPSEKSWQNMKRTRSTSAKKYQQIAGFSAHCFNAMAEKKNR
jgi:hypothetical protein